MDVKDKSGIFYKAQDQLLGTHFALRWNGRVRFIVPRESGGQKACWKAFRPGRLTVLLRAMAYMPRLSCAVGCSEATNLLLIRKALGKEAVLSCCRTGTEGVWSKDTILFLDKREKPLCIVKAGTGKAVNVLLDNEAKWLKRLKNQAALMNHIPALVAYRSGADLSFVAQSALSGDLDYKLKPFHFDFLRKLQVYSFKSKQYKDSHLYQNLNLRLNDLRGLLTEEWSIRLDTAMQRIEELMSGSLALLVAAHNDFAPWNIRVQNNTAFVFDWEFADDEQFPLFDPLHFALMPVALKSASLSKMIRTIDQTLHLCRQWLGENRCYKSEAQVLAYLVNLCTLYLWADRGQRNSHPALVSYARILDRMCHHVQRS